MPETVLMMLMLLIYQWYLVPNEMISGDINPSISDTNICVKLLIKSLAPGRCGIDLTHWGQVRHICISKLTIIGSDNGLSPTRRQAIIWTNAGILLIGPLGTNFIEILIAMQTFSFKKTHLKMLSGKRRSFCLGLNVLKVQAPNICYRLNSGALLVILLSSECLRQKSNFEVRTVLAENNFKCISIWNEILSIPNKKFCSIFKDLGWGAVSDLSQISDLSQKFKHDLWRVKPDLKLSQKQHLTPDLADIRYVIISSESGLVPNRWGDKSLCVEQSVT